MDGRADNPIVDEATVRDRLSRWSFPLGPLVSPEDVDADMAAYARELGPGAAPGLARMLVAFADAGDPSTDALYEFIYAYADEHPEATGRALLDALRPDGPPQLVDLIGLTQAAGAVGRLRDVVALDGSSDDLLASVAGALGELGGPEAAALLDELASGGDLGPAARRELAIARQALSDA
jgi:hypothetical protein